MTELYIAGVGAYLPDRVSTADAMACGDYRADRGAVSGIESACVSTDLTAPEMAVLAGRDALAMAAAREGEQATRDVRAVLHSFVNFQGARFWDAAPYVAMHTVGASVPGYDVLQSCNGALACMQMAGGLIGMGGRGAGGGSVLVTAADRFDTEGVDRWNADPQAVFGDGAGAVLLSGTGGIARVLAITTSADNRLEAESRGDTFTRNLAHPLDFEKLREDYMRTAVPMRQHLFAMQEVLTSTLKRALDEAATTLDELAFVVPIAPTYPLLRGMLENLIRVPESKTTWDLGKTTGHIGSADHLVGLHHLISSGAAQAGDRILLVGGGTGFTCTFAILEMTVRK